MSSKRSDKLLKIWVFLLLGYFGFYLLNGCTFKAIQGFLECSRVARLDHGHPFLDDLICYRFLCLLACFLLDIITKAISDRLGARSPRWIAGNSWLETSFYGRVWSWHA